MLQIDFNCSYYSNGTTWQQLKVVLHLNYLKPLKSRAWRKYLTMLDHQILIITRLTRTSPIDNWPNATVIYKAELAREDKTSSLLHERKRILTPYLKQSKIPISIAHIYLILHSNFKVLMWYALETSIEALWFGVFNKGQVLFFIK